MMVRRLTCALAALSAVSALTLPVAAVAMNKHLQNRVEAADMPAVQQVNDACAALGGRPSQTFDGEIIEIACSARRGSRLDSLMLACRKAGGEYRGESGRCLIHSRHGHIHQRP